jgi:hypothetical protein
MMMWPGDRRPSYEELAAENAALRETIEDLQAVVTALRAEIAELKRQLGQDSSNSSKPPSTDSPFAKPAPKSLRRQSGRKPGGQPGHPGSTLPLVADPKTRLRHEPGACGGCGADLAEAPDGVTAPVLYGPQITAIVLYRYVGQFLSKKRAAQALAELFGTPLSEGTVAAMCERAASGLDGFLDVVRDRIADAESAGFDETGLRVASSLHWVHCARTGKYTLITCHAKRGKQGIDDMGVLGRFKGVAVHDAWAPYDTYLDPAHQLCCAHALRELQGVADAAPPDAQWCWATQESDALVAMQQLAADATATGAVRIDPDALAEQVRGYRSAAQIGCTETAARSNKVMKKHNALARRLLARQDDYLRFTTDLRVPPDNNGSERDIRMIKLRQKVSGCLRTLTGAKQFCAIRSYLSTAAKHGRNFFDTVVMLTEGRLWLPAAT